MQGETFTQNYGEVRFDFEVVSDDTIAATAELAQGTYLIEGNLIFTYKGKSTLAREGVWQWNFTVQEGEGYDKTAENGVMLRGGEIGRVLQSSSEAMHRALQEAKKHRRAMRIDADDKEKKLSSLWDSLQHFQGWHPPIGRRNESLDFPREQ